MRFHALLLGLLIIGCPEPTADPEGGGTPGAGAEAPSGELPAGEIPAGEPAGAEPTAEGGAAEAAPEGAPLPDAGGVPQVDSTPSTGAPGAGQVAISGILSYEGSKTGQYRIEFLQVSEGGPPTMVHYEPVEKPGPWKAFAPINAGEIRVVAFLDQAGDGASSDDPGAAWPDPVEVGSEDVTGIDLVLTDDPDLGDLAPKDHMDAAVPPVGDDAAPGAAGEDDARDAS